MAYKLLLFIAALLLSQNGMAKSYYHAFTDEINVYQEDKSIFNAERLEELKASDNYDYNEELETSNWWTEFKEWLLIQLKKIFGSDFSPDSFIVKFINALPYIIPAIAVIIIVWYIIKVNPGSQVMRQHNSSKVILTEEEELLMQKNLDGLASQAITNKEFRLAVRYMYLNCIKRLDMKRIIRYAYDKTNYEYVKEIQFSEVSIQFKTLTLSYEQIWYGQMVVNDPYFLKYRLRYENFQKLLDQKQYAKG